MYVNPSPLLLAAFTRARLSRFAVLCPAWPCSQDGAFGIRIENLFVVVEADTPFRRAAAYTVPLPGIAQRRAAGVS